MESAGSFVKKSMDAVVSDPSAVLETPSLNDLARGVESVQADVAELKKGLAQILARLGPPPPQDLPPSSKNLGSFFA